MKLYAFWKYDTFPYLLGAEVGTRNGMRVSPLGYGGYTFTAKFFLPDELGESLVNELKEISAKREQQIESINSKYKEELSSLLYKFGR